MPSTPRFVRVNDTFEAGVVVTVERAPATVIITASIVPPNATANATAGPEPLVATGSLTKTLKFAAGGGLSAEARFEFAAVAVGTASVLFSAEATVGAEGGPAIRDALQLEIPVEGRSSVILRARSGTLYAAWRYVCLVWVFGRAAREGCDQPWAHAAPPHRRPNGTPPDVGPARRLCLLQQCCDLLPVPAAQQASRAPWRLQTPYMGVKHLLHACNVPSSFV